jgi:hypothetical protein
LKNQTRNALAVVAVGALFIALTFLGPDWYKREAEFRCPPDYKLQSIYPNMVECHKAMKALSGMACSCARPENPWARFYADYVLPPLIGVAASLLLIGSIAMRVALLNAGYWSALLVLGVYYGVTNPEGIEGLLLSLGHLIYVAIVASVVLVVLNLLARSMRRVKVS